MASATAHETAQPRLAERASGDPNATTAEASQAVQTTPPDSGGIAKSAVAGKKP